MNNRTTADTILAQFGGTKFIAMTSARDFVYGHYGLAFTIGRNARHITRVCVKLLADDTYRVEFWQTTAAALRCAAAFNGLHADDLGPTFTRETGLETSL